MEISSVLLSLLLLVGSQQRLLEVKKNATVNKLTRLLFALNTSPVQKPRCSFLTLRQGERPTLQFRFPKHFDSQKKKKSTNNL